MPNRHVILWRLTNVLIGVLVIGGSGWLSACGRIQRTQPQAEEISIDMATAPDQPTVGPARLIIMLTDKNGQPIDNAVLNIEGNMTHAGMVPVLAQATAGQDGRYEVPFEWTMSGDWLVTVDVALPDGRQLTREIPVSVQ